MSPIYVQTFSGEMIDLYDPDPKKIRLKDICHALSQINRFSGATPIPYSVAEHSILVYRILLLSNAKAYIRLQGLLHDAHEAFTGDITSPVQLASQMRYFLRGLQRSLDRAIVTSLNIIPPPEEVLMEWDAEVLRADKEALSLEYYQWFHDKSTRSWGEGVIIPRSDLWPVAIPEFKDKRGAAKELEMLIRNLLRELGVSK